MSVPIHVGDVGTVFRLTVREPLKADRSNADPDDPTKGQRIDISDATTTTIRFQRPDQTTVDKDADFTTDGTDGEMEYVAEVGFIAAAGDWLAEGYAVTPDGTWSTTSKKFTVRARLPVPV